MVLSRSARPGADVLLVINDLAPYGSQRVALSLVEQWAVHRSVVVATLEQPGGDDLTLPTGVVRRQLHRSGPRAWALVSLAVQLRYLVARERPQHVLSHMTFANIITLLALCGSRRRPVVVEHNLLSRNLGEQAGGRVSAWLFRVLHPVAGAVVGVSDAVVDDVHEHSGVPRSRLRRLYNPVPHRAARSSEPPHEWLDPDRSTVTLVCVGGLRRAKGQDVLVDALAVLRARGDRTTRLVLVGDGPTAAVLQRRAAEAGVLDAVHFAGYQGDALAWVSRSDALVMPSRWDSFGLVAVEAARCGVPVIASDVPGLREIVPHHVPGWSVPPEDPERLADALAAIGRAPRSRPTELDLREFEPSVVAERYLRLLQETHQP